MRGTPRKASVATLPSTIHAGRGTNPLWDELFLAEQARIIALTVERVDIGTDAINVRMRMIVSRTWLTNCSTVLATR